MPAVRPTDGFRWYVYPDADDTSIQLAFWDIDHAKAWHRALGELLYPPGDDPFGWSGKTDWPDVLPGDVIAWKLAQTWSAPYQVASVAVREGVVDLVTSGHGEFHIDASTPVKIVEAA